MRKLVFTLTVMSSLLLSGCSSSVPNGVVRPAQEITQLPKASDVQSLDISSDSAGSVGYEPNNQTAIISQILNWLKSAEPVSVQFPQLESKEQWASGGYTGPSTLHLQLNDKQTITIIPAYYIWTNSKGGFDYHYLDGVIGYENWKGWTYFKAPALYQWLKEDRWKQQFHMMGQPSRHS